MSGFGLFLLFLGVAVYGVVSVAQGRIRRHGFLVLVWRFLSGQPWHGKPLTDAGWVRPGAKVLGAARTGHATRFQHMPRWRRAMWRSGTVAVLVLATWGLLVARTVAVRAILIGTVILAVYGLVRGWFAFRRRSHHRTWMVPAWGAIAPLIGVAAVERPENWMQVRRVKNETVYAALALPSGKFLEPQEKQKIEAALAGKLGMDGPEPKWHLAGPKPTLILTVSTPPPEKVTLDDLQDALDKARPDELVLGLGRKRKVVTVSLSGDSPHIGLSMGSGGGKSVAAQLIAAQLLHRGGLAVFLDIKRISHAWAYDLPNAAYARTIAQIHQFLLLLAREVAYRNQVAEESVDVEGKVHGKVGPRILIVVEEINATRAQLRSYWKSVRDPSDPVRSPAESALDEILFVGRQVRMNVLMIGQRLSANAAGGGDARENLAVMVMGRYKTSTWKMLAGDFPMPPKSLTPGRAQVVTESVAETQIGFLTGSQALEYATNGVLGSLPQRFGGPSVEGVTPAQQIVEDGSDQRFVTGTGVPLLPPADEPVTLRQAVQLGLVDRSLPALRMARHRDKTFPVKVGQRGIDHLYDPDELARWGAGIQ